MNDKITLTQKIKTLKEKKDNLKIIHNKLKNVGKIMIDDDKIICYKNQTFIDKKVFLQKNIYLSNIINEYSIYYIFSKLVFNDSLVIVANEANLIFESCEFNNGIEVKWAKTLVLKNNYYKELPRLLLPWNQNALVTGNVENLLISDNRELLDIDIKANKEINVVNSDLRPQNNGTINLEANNINVYHSKVSELAHIESPKTNFIRCLKLYEDNTKRVKKQNIKELVK